MEKILFILLVGTDTYQQMRAQSNSALKCYNGLMQNGKESPGMKVKQADCEYGMDECATVKYTMNILGFTVNATQATCTSKALNCQLCSFLNSSITDLGECNATCCDSDLCNDDIIKSVQRTKDPEKEEKDESVQCYVGQEMLLPLGQSLNSNKVMVKDCPDTTQCLTIDYTIDMFGMKVPAMQGLCGMKLMDCDNMCNTIKSSMKGFSLSYCKSECCDGDKCNKKVIQLSKKADKEDERQ